MPGEKRRLAFFALLIAAFALLSYSQFFGIRLLEFDAVGKIASHSSRSPAEIINILTQPEQHYTLISTNYRPVQTLIQWAVFLLFGLDFSAFHWLNFLFHAVNSVLVFFVARKLLGDKAGFFSFLAGLVFALHPIHLNTVLFVSRVAELIVGFSLLSSLLLLMKSLEEKKPLFFLLSVVCCAIGVFSKETGLLIPFVLFFYALVFSGEKRFRNAFSSSLRFCWPFFSLVALYAALMFFSLGKAGGYLNVLPSPRSRIVLYFFQHLLYPVDFLKINFDGAVNSFFGLPGADPVFLVLFFAGCAIAVWFLSKNHGRKPLLFLLCWLLAFLFALLAYNYVTPWYSYAPAIAFALLSGLLLQKSARISRKDFSTAAVAGIALSLFSLAAFSPLFASYPSPKIAGDITSLVLYQTASEAARLPSASELYLVNYPVMLSAKENGFNYPAIMLNDQEIMAFLDFYLPEKKFSLRSLTMLVIVNPRQLDFEYLHDGNCAFVLQNNSVNSARVYPLGPTWSGSQLRPIEGFNFKTAYGDGTESISIGLQKKDWRDSFLLVFDGKRVNVLGMAELCK